jgi:type II secretory pathway component GspD/PulD (secretin)
MRILVATALCLFMCWPVLAQNDDTDAPDAGQKPRATTAPTRPANPTKPEGTGKPDAGGPKKDDNGGGTHILSITSSPKGWTIHAVNADAHELLTEFAAAAHLPLVVDDTVKRKITLHIVDKSETDILALVVDAYGFSWAQVEGVHIISDGMPRTPSSYLLSDIASVTTKYVAPAQAQQLLPLFLQQHVKVNTDQNAVVLSGPKPMLEKFREDVAQFDVPAAQIMLDVNVIEFTDVDTDTFAALLGNADGKLGITTDSLTGQLTLSAIADLPRTFLSRLQALITKRQARVRACPRIATVSGQSASIFIGQQQYLTIPLGYGSTSIDAGVSLTMTPLTGGGGEIILDLREEISTLSAPDPTTNLPTKTSRTASTTVRVRDGQTITLGGLRQSETRSVRRAIPILSEIPLVGQLFRSHKDERTVVDLAVFITARSLSQTGHLPPAEEEKARTFLQEMNHE